MGREEIQKAESPSWSPRASFYRKGVAIVAHRRWKSSEPCALEEEVIEVDEEEAKAIAGFLGFMAGHGGRARRSFRLGLIWFVRNM